MSNKPCCTPTGCDWEQRPRGYHCRGGAYGGCGRTFSSLSGFDAHRRDDRCHAPEHLKDGKGRLLGYTEDANGIWGLPAPEGGFAWARQS